MGCTFSKPSPASAPPPDAQEEPVHIDMRPEVIIDDNNTPADAAAPSTSDVVRDKTEESTTVPAHD